MAEASGNPGRQRAVAWGTVALWTGLIFFLSTNSFSADETSRVIGPLLDFFFPGLDPARRDFIHFLIRKSAHAFEYGVLGILAWRALRIGPPGRELRSVVLALALVASVATLDETGQTTRPSRTGSPRDVAIDTAGGAAGLGLALAVRAVSERRTAA